MASTYQMIGADGVEYGPVTLEEFRDWAKEGRVVGSTQVRRTGDESWSTAANFPELGVVDAVGIAATALPIAVAEDPAEAAELEKKIKSCGSWFYWIAALTLINTIVAMCGSNWGFVLGLTITQLIDAVVVTVVPQEFSLVAKLAVCAVDLVAVGLFVFLGVMACRKQMWPFAVGVTLYGLDTLLTLLSFSIVSIGIHGWALFSLVMGMRAAQEWKKLAQNNSLTTPAIA
jgi:GYF domain 2